MAEEAMEEPRYELLRLIVRETWKLSNNALWLRKCQLSQQGGCDLSQNKSSRLISSS